jgi:3-oxoacyl-[acyl-carrier-protein] synthase-1
LNQLYGGHSAVVLEALGVAFRPIASGYPYCHNTFSVAAFVRGYLGLSGPAAVISTACSSSAKVFASAARLMRAGLCDAAVVGGVDSLCLTTLYGFSALELTAAGPCRPCDVERDGLSIGEAAGFALIERVDLAGSAGGCCSA